MKQEVGKWHHTPEVMSAFLTWCRVNEVRTYGSIKITSTAQYARCLRAKRTIHPGEVIITVPYKTCFNFMVAAQEQGACSASAFPLPLHWMNYNERLDFLPSAATHELSAAGWMVRIASLEESPLTPYVQFLLQDTRGSDGISSGISKERGEDTGMLDHYLSQMATDACEEPDVFLPSLFTALACLHLRTQPIEEAAIQAYMGGTNFFKAKADTMFVPTLMPLIDCVPQLETGNHNTTVEYFPYRGISELKVQCAELHLPLNESASQGADGHLRRPLMSPDRLQGGGFFALRAIQCIEEGNVLHLRRYPADGRVEEGAMQASVQQASEILSRE